MTTAPLQPVRYGGPTAVPGQEFRCGSFRKSMTNNPLLTEAEVGKNKKALFNTAPPGYSFGQIPPVFEEGVREIIGKWHYAEPDKKRRGAADFRAMNKLAAAKGVVKSDQQLEFRRQNPKQVRIPSKPQYKCAPKMPASKAQQPTFGGLSVKDPEAAPAAGDAQFSSTGKLLQAAYAQDWVNRNAPQSSLAQAARARDERLAAAHQRKGGGGGPAPQWLEPCATLASKGHSCARTREEEQKGRSVDAFKMPRFLGVGSKVETFRTAPPPTTASRQGQLGSTL